MRWIVLVALFAILATTLGEPVPKKYRSQIKLKERLKTAVLTEEEKEFIREVEAKFGVKPDLSDVSKESKEGEDNDITVKATSTKKTPAIKAPFPAVIAIEIVNDTETEGKSGGNKKRTIDANLGYGYQTNGGYTYTYVGKNENKGKFMIYPYSQEDIPASTTNSHSYQNTYNQSKSYSTEVEITPSQAYELVPEQKEEEPTSYHYEKPAVEFNTKYENNQGNESPSSYSAPSKPTTLYTTYNGQKFSGLSGQFPAVMPNYLVDSSQLLSNPQYQSSGLTQDHLQSHAHSGQRVVPVLVLKIPSSYLKNPSAELYSDFPQNSPLYLNNINLQDLVNQYFSKLGYHQAPHVMTYNHPFSTARIPINAPLVNYEPQPYANPYAQPIYTQSDYSGVQYSAVKPVMALYPSGYSQQYYINRGQSLYQIPPQQHGYQYLPQHLAHSQMYYVSPQKQLNQDETYQVSSNQNVHEQSLPAQQLALHETNVRGSYGQGPSGGSQVTSGEYNVPQTPAPEYETSSISPDYGSVDTATSHAELSQHEHEEQVTSNIQVQNYGAQSQAQYEQPINKETVAIYPRAQSGHRYNAEQQIPQNYAYQQHATQEDSNDHGLILSENYPSKDHTIATVLPLSYRNRSPAPNPVQGVNYVTPVPHMKYHSKYKVMVPQTIFRPSDERVAYVNSQTQSAAYQHLTTNAEEEYTANPHYVPALGKQRAPVYPRNYHAHPKRMSRSEQKSDSVTLLVKKRIERSENKSLHQ